MSSSILDENSNNHFYKKILVIGLPIALAQLMTGLLSVIDTIMVSNLGNTAIAAVGVGSNFAFLLIMIQFGFFSGLAIFIAQYYGSKDIKSIHKVFIISIIIGAFLSSIFFIFGFFFPELVISFYNNSDDIANSLLLKEFGVSYLRVAAFSYFAMTIIFIIGMLMRSVEKVLYPQLVAISTVLINTVLNYLLINGNFCFPALGVEGAAIATLISTIFGAILLISYLIISKNEVFKIKFILIKDITKSFVLKILKKVLPVAINETIWGLGMTFFLIAYGTISTDSLTSVHISNQVIGLFWAVNAGISSACAIMLGNKLGANKLDLAKNWGKRFVKLSFFAGVFFGILLFLLSDNIAGLYKNTTNDVRENVSLILKVFSIYLPIKFSNVLQIIGTLRAGGDTLYTLLAEIIPLWGVGVPLAFILSIYTNLPLHYIIAIVNLEEIIKLILLFSRFLTFKWVRNLTIEQAT